MNKKELSIKPLFGIPIISTSQEEVIALLASQIEEKREKSIKIVYTPNPEQVTRAFHESRFLEVLQHADWNLPDGQGIAWALHVKRIAGRVIFHELLRLGKERQWKIFLLGGKPGSGLAVAKKFQNPNNKNQIQLDDGALDISHETAEEEERVLRHIAAVRPQILFVAYGAPWQEYWVAKHKDDLAAAGVHVAMVVGGSFEYEAGVVAPVPALVDRAHLEWLWRLLHEPWRAGRQLRGLEFFWRVLMSR